MKRLYVCFYVVFLRGLVIHGASVSFPPIVSINQSTETGLIVWQALNPSVNCQDNNNVAAIYPSTAAKSNILNFFGWYYVPLNYYAQVSNMTVMLQSRESPPEFFDDPVVKAYDRCGYEIVQRASPSLAYPEDDVVQRTYNYNFLPSKLSADYFKNNFLVTIQVARNTQSPGAGSTWAPLCLSISFDADSTPSSTPSNPCTASSQSPSPSPSPAFASPSPSRQSQGGTSGGSGSNIGIIAGAIAAALVGVAIIAALAFFLIVKRKKQHKGANPKNMEGNSGESTIRLRPDSISPYSDIPKSSHSSFVSTNARGSTLVSSELYIDDIKLRGLLGKGKFGEVYEGKWHGTTAVACKKLKKDDKEEFENEIMLLMKLNHPNVVRCLGIWSNPTNGEIFMILELLRLGSLTNFLRNSESQKKLAIADLVEMCVHAASGMVFLEQKNIVHRDLGARNLLVTESDGRYVVKISDFGLSRQVEENEAIYNSKEGVFPVKWSPPEVINFRKFTSKSDVWSFGITMWEIFELGKVPYPTWTNDEAVAKVLQGYRLPRPDTCPEVIYTLMLQCWSANPEHRPNFKSVHDQLLQSLKNIRGEDEDQKYTTEEGEKNYESYNNANKNETYNNQPPNTYNTNM